MITTFLLFIPASIFFISVLSYMFDTLENSEFLFPMVIYLGLLPYIAVTVVDMLNVMDGELGKILHCIFSVLVVPYVPMGILYMLT